MFVACNGPMKPPPTRANPITQRHSGASRNPATFSMRTGGASRAPVAHALQKRDRFLDAFERAHRRVFVLDAEHAVVTGCSERRDELVPPRLGMSMPEGHVAPRPMLEIAARRGVDHAIDA